MAIWNMFLKFFMNFAIFKFLWIFMFVLFYVVLFAWCLFLFCFFLSHSDWCWKFVLLLWYVDINHLWNCMFCWSTTSDQFWSLVVNDSLCHTKLFFVFVCLFFLVWLFLPCYLFNFVSLSDWFLGLGFYLSDYLFFVHSLVGWDGWVCRVLFPLSGTVNGF